jgi:TRAP-type transport system periplasmic protein
MYRKSVGIEKIKEGVSQMKKARSMMLIVSLCLILVLATIAMPACSTKAPATVTTTATTTAVTTATATVTAVNKPIKLVFQSMEAGNSMYNKNVFEPLWAAIEEQTGGRVLIERHYNSDLVALPDVWDATVNGTVDISQGLTAFVPGKFPLDEVMLLHSLDVLCYRTGTVTWELYKEFPEWQAQYKDVKLLALWSEPHVYLTSTAKAGPINSLETLKGKKLIVSSSWSSERVAGLGATPVSVPPTGYTELQKGVVDGGLFTNCHLFYDFRLGEVTKYVTMVYAGGADLNISMNKKKWDSIPADCQQIIDKLTGDALVGQMDKLNILQDKADRASVVKDFGIEFVDITPAEVARWVALDQPVHDKFAKSLDDKGLPGTKLMSEYLRLEKKYSDQQYAFN